MLSSAPARTCSLPPPTPLPLPISFPQVKSIMGRGAQLFNQKPKRGIDFFVKQGFIERTPADIARLFHTTPALSPTMIGEFFGDPSAHCHPLASCSPLKPPGLQRNTEWLAMRVCDIPSPGELSAFSCDLPPCAYLPPCPIFLAGHAGEWGEHCHNGKVFCIRVT